MITSPFPLWDIPTIPIAGRAERFPVRHVYCVGRNYAEHTKEMGGDAAKDPPFFFTKPASSVMPNNSSIRYGLGSQDYQHEVELVVAIGKTGVKIPAAQANDYIYGYAVGFDMTRRDLQIKMREQKRPWCVGKAFAESAPCAAIHRASDMGHPNKGAIWIDVNGVRKQTGDLSDLIWDVPHTIEFLSSLWELHPGDLIFTGTPAGVAKVMPGDTMHGHIDGLTDLHITVAPAIA
jgi:fumarylpyruvate hydrolase